MANEPKKGISKALKTFFGVGDAGFSFMANIETYYFNYFLTNVAQFSVGVTATITTIASTVDMLLSWVYGIFLNTVRAPKWGRYRSWLVLVPWIVPFLYAFQFIRINDGPAAVVVIILATITSHIAWNIPYTANMTMIGIAASNAEERAALSSSRSVWTSLARVGYSYIGPGFVAFIAATVGQKYSYGACAFCFACLMVAGYYAHFKMFEGYEETGDEERARLAAQGGGEKKAAGPKVNIGTFLKSNVYLLVVIIANTLASVFSFVLGGMAAYYFEFVAGQKGLTSTYLLISNLFAVAGSYLARKIVSQFSTKTAALIAYGASAALMIIAYMLRGSVWAVIWIVSIGQFFYMMSMAITPVLYSNCAIYSEWQTGINAMGAIMGFSTIPIKVGVVLRGLLIAAVLAAAGYSAEAAAAGVTQQMSDGLAFGFMIVPAITAAAAFLCILLFFKLDDDAVDKYQKEIAARKAA